MATTAEAKELTLEELEATAEERFRAHVRSLGSAEYQRRYAKHPMSRCGHEVQFMDMAGEAMFRLDVLWNLLTASGVVPFADEDGYALDPLLWFKYGWPLTTEEYEKEVGRDEPGQHVDHLFRSWVELWNGDKVRPYEASLYVPKDRDTGELGEAVYIYADADRQEAAEALTPLPSAGSVVEKRVRAALAHAEPDDELAHAAAEWLEGADPAA